MGGYLVACFHGFHGVRLSLTSCPVSQIINKWNSTFTCIGVVPVAGRIVLDLEGRESKSSSVLLVTIWELGEAAGPLIISPLSEGKIDELSRTFNILLTEAQCMADI